ncbi:hypothetical protein D3C72_1079280 [compost metagenome]
MAARLFIRVHAVPHLVRIEVAAVHRDERSRIGVEDAGNEALAHQHALAVAAIRIEAVADDGLAVAEYVRDDGHQAQGHLAEIDIGVADGGRDGDGLFADFNDFHAGLL